MIEPFHVPPRALRAGAAAPRAGRSPALTRRLGGLLLALVLGLAGLAWAQVARGDALVDQGDFPSAVEAYDVALERDGDDARALYQRSRARVYWADDDASLSDEEREALYERALADAERAVDLAPNDAEAHFELSRALGRTAQFRGVLQSLNLAARTSDALDRALELDPDHAGAWHARGLWHVEVPWLAGGRGGLVEPAFERAIEIEPGVIGHRVAYAGVLIDREAYDRAASQLDAAAAIAPETYLDRKDLEEADTLRSRLP